MPDKVGHSSFDSISLSTIQTYTLATHPSQSGGSDFSVRVSTIDCSSKGRRKVCSKAISLLWSGHEARVEIVDTNQVLSLSLAKLSHWNSEQATVYFDQLAETQLPVTKHGISIRLQTAHHYVIQLDQLHVKVLSYMLSVIDLRKNLCVFLCQVKLNLENAEFSLSLPHSLHGGKMRGLCGNFVVLFISIISQVIATMCPRMTL